MSSIQGISATQATVDVAQTVQGLTDQQMVQVLDSAIKDGADIVQDTKTQNYYLKTTAQFSAGQGESFVKVDAQLADAIFAALSTGGRISTAEVMDKIMPEITDGGRYGEAEAILSRLLLAATDDRKIVKLGGKRIFITDKAEGTLKHALASFWGKLGAKARWAKDPTEEIIKGTPTGQNDPGGYPIYYILPPQGAQVGTPPTGQA